MKKLLSGIALASMMATTAMANSGHNVIIGLGAGMQSLRTHVKQDYNQFPEHFSVSDTNFAGSAFLGYRTTMGMFLGGVEVDMTTPTAYKNEASNTSATTNYKIKAGMAFGGSVLLGAQVTDTAYVAVRFGTEYRKYTLDPRLGSGLTPVAGTGDKRSMKGFSFVPGVLLGTSFNGCWDIAADYRINLGKKKSSGSVAANTLSLQAKNTSQTFMLKLAYKFGI